MQINFYGVYWIYTSFVINARENHHFSHINSNLKKFTIVLVLMFITMLVLYQTNNLSQKKYRSPSKFKSYKSYSNMAAGHCSLLELHHGHCYSQIYTILVKFYLYLCLIWVWGILYGGYQYTFPIILGQLWPLNLMTSN